MKGLVIGGKEAPRDLTEFWTECLTVSNSYRPVSASDLRVRAAQVRSLPSDVDRRANTLWCG
jgi:hypothetical protein